MPAGNIEGTYDGCTIQNEEVVDLCTKDPDNVWRIHRVTIRHWKCDTPPIFRNEVLSDVGTQVVCVPP